MKKWLIIIIIILLAVIGAGWQQIKHANEKWLQAMTNVKAYQDEIGGLKEQATVFQMTIDQFKYLNDSISQKMQSVQKELKIKDKQLTSMHYIYSAYSRKDTIIVNDTIFKQFSFELDTLLQDEWYSLRVGLKFPSMIAVHPSFKSEKFLVTSAKRETVNPPKKFFLFRWFQKKHTVLKVTVVEKSPYITEENQRFVEIIK